MGDRKDRTAMAPSGASAGSFDVKPAAADSKSLEKHPGYGRTKRRRSGFLAGKSFVSPRSQPAARLSGRRAGRCPPG